MKWEWNKFTGQKEVASIGLYYYGARYYDPGMGRFITEDTYRGELNNSQSQNLYVYVMNNPLRYVDPSGHRPVLTDDPREQTIEQTRVLNNLAYGDEEIVEATELYLKIKSAKFNNTEIELPKMFKRWNMKKPKKNIKRNEEYNEKGYTFTKNIYNKTSYFGLYKYDIETSVSLNTNVESNWQFDNEGSYLIRTIILIWK